VNTPPQRSADPDDSNPTYSHSPRGTSEHDPWLVDVTGHGDEPCSCPPPPHKDPKKPCTRSKAKPKDCCETILEMLDPARGEHARGHKIHKPKQPPMVKLANWCCDWPIKDSLAPILALIWRRVQKGIAPKNDFEKAMVAFFDRLAPRHREALEVGMKAYEKIPDGRRCAFEDRFDEWPDDRPLDPAFLTKVLLEEIVKLGRHGVFNVGDGKPSISEMRIWKLPNGPFISETERQVVPGPWPWICAVNPGADNVKWFRNLDVIFPDKAPISSFKPDLHEFSVTCKVTTDPANPKNLNVTCADNVPTTGFAVCEGGNSYNFHEPGTGKFRCLKIPVCVAGQGVALQGFNYLSMNCKVVVKKADGKFPDMVLPCDVMSDDNPPTKNASCSVRDRLTFTLPRTIRDGLNDRPVPPGRYSIEVHVPNETNYAPAPGFAPAEFVSNVALIDIVPPLDITYQVWVDRGNCYEETDGLGSDEPWFVGYTGTYQAVGSQVIDTVSHEILKEDDVDSGDWIGFSPVQLFSAQLKPEGCVGIAVLGLEVDSDDAAKEQVTSFGEAYELYWKQFFTVLSSGTAGGLLGDGIAAAIGGAGITASLVVGGIALIVIAGLGLFYAAWAPADPIGYDLIIYDQVSLFFLTTPGSPLPLQDAGGIGYITWSTFPKGITPTSATTAEYREERQYRAQDEDSKYGLDFRVTRLP